MPLPPSIRTGLAEYWKFDEGAGTVAYGALGQLNLSLSLDGGAARGANGLNGHWHAPGTDNQFAGLAEAFFPGMWHVLENEGDAVTIGLWHWYGGYETTLDPLVSPVVPLSIGMVILDHGTVAADVLLAYGTGAPPPADASLNIHVYISSFTPNGVDHFINAPPYANTVGSQAAYLALVEVVRGAGNNITCTLWIDGSPNMGPLAYAADPNITRIKFGGNTPAGIRGAAIWLRTLTTPERDGIFDAAGPEDLDDPDPDPPGPEVLVDDGGNSVFHPKWIAPLELGYGTLAQDGNHRETRLAHEKVTQAYRLALDLGNRAEVAALRAAIAETRGGAGFVRWRHPQDDAMGTPDTAPYYRIMEDVEFTRTRGGQFAELVVVMERA